MRINQNIAALNAHRQMSITNNALGVSLERLSSGLRINKAKDDVAGLAIANQFRADVRSLRMAQQNVAQANSMLQTADGAANQVQGILERLKELATLAASDNTSDAGRTALNNEAQELIAEIDRIAADTKYAGTSLINGTGGTLEFQIGTTDSADARIEVGFGAINFTAAGLGVDGVDISDKTTAQTALDDIDDAISAAGVGMGAIGAAQSRLEFAGLNLATTIENVAASESVIRDADMAFEMIAFTRNQIMLQAGTAMLAQANMSTQAVLGLF